MNVESPQVLHSPCAFLLLTESCNLRCSHCYVESGPAVGIHMPLRIIEATFDLLAELGVDDIRLTGGEPSIHPQFDLIIQSALQRGFRLGLVSNGIRLFQGGGGLDFFSALSRCWISIYGTSAESHSRISGRTIRTYPETINQVGALASQGCWIGLSVLASPGDSKNIGDLMSAAHGAGIKKLRVLPIQPDGRACSSSINWSAWPEEVLSIANLMANHHLSSQFDVLTINDPFDLANRFIEGNASCLLRSRRMWSITPDGSVYPCCFTVYSDSLSLGNVLDRATLDRLKEFKASCSIYSACHGLKSSFWRDAATKTITCPIGSIDVRYL
jgi:MoaA/NifB/PqqE/SkfB family radical SAM enzyme